RIPHRLLLPRTGIGGVRLSLAEVGLHTQDAGNDRTRWRSNDGGRRADHHGLPSFRFLRADVVYGSNGRFRDRWRSLATHQGHTSAEAPRTVRIRKTVMSAAMMTGSISHRRPFNADVAGLLYLSGILTAA